MHDEDEIFYSTKQLKENKGDRLTEIVIYVMGFGYLAGIVQMIYQAL